MRKAYFLSIILLMMITGCTEAQLESKFREQVLPDSLGDITAVKKYGIRYFDEGAIVVYTGEDPQRKGHSYLGYAVFQQDLGIWRSNQGGGSSHPKRSLSDKLVEYNMFDFNFQGMGRTVTFNHRLLFGEILSPTVHTVEVVLDDGTIMRDGGEGGVFALYVDTNHTFCELRVFDDEGRLLKSLVPKYEAGPSPAPGPKC